MEYDFEYETNENIPRTVHVVMNLELLEIQTQNRFGPEIRFRLGSRRIAEILDHENKNIKSQCHDIQQEILDHFHECHLQRLVADLETQRRY